PVIESVKLKTPYSSIVLSYGLGAERFSRKGVAYVEIDKIKRDDGRVPEFYRPNLVITSATSLPDRDMSEKHLWRNARRLGIPSLAFLDQWQNYAIRFSGVTKDERLAYLPDYINCIDEIGEREMLSEGFPGDRLVRLGHPYLSALHARAGEIDPVSVKARMGIPHDQKAALFVSEPILEYYGRARGYDQYEALGLFFDIVSANPVPILPVIKLHPKDERERFKKILDGHKRLSPVLLGNEFSSLECLSVADSVYGMSSIMLIEAYVMGKYVVSLQPGLIVEDPLVLSRHHIIPVITSPNGAGFTGTDIYGNKTIINYRFDWAAFYRLLKRIMDDSK
ncbi:MAG TPA: hypothetical protein VI728_11470, partial [Syntrophales bacterium]|nr:hypothetical protein [Syntrophales bacterium]